jgi:Flp pilus assembly protein TadB
MEGVVMDMIPAWLTEGLTAVRDSLPWLPWPAGMRYGAAFAILSMAGWAAILAALLWWQRRSDRRYRRLWEIEDQLLLESFTPEYREHVLRWRQAARARLRQAEEILRREGQRGAQRR